MRNISSLITKAALCVMIVGVCLTGSAQATYYDHSILFAGGLSSPTPLAIDANDNLLVVKAGNPLICNIVDEDGRVLRTIAMDIPSDCYSPCIDVGEDGTICIGIMTAKATESAWLQLYNNKGDAINTINLEDFGRCDGVVLDAAGDVWVTSQYPYGLRKFDRVTGNMLAEFMTIPGMPDRNTWVRPSGMAMDDLGRIFVTDNSRVVRFHPGDYVGTMKTFVGTPQLSVAPDAILRGQVFDVDVDAAGNVYVVCAENKAIQVFRANGDFLHEIGAPELNRPKDVAVDSLGNVYVSEDEYPPQIHKFSPIPEPATMSLLGIICVLALRRKSV